MGRYLGFSPYPSPFSPAWLPCVMLTQKPESIDHAVLNHPQKVIQFGRGAPLLSGHSLKVTKLQDAHVAPALSWQLDSISTQSRHEPFFPPSCLFSAKSGSCSESLSSSMMAPAGPWSRGFLGLVGIIWAPRSAVF